jgi:hypothetical protein
MRKTTNFKRFERGGAVMADIPPVPPVAIVDIERNDDASDDASEAFKKQIEALRQSEEIHRDRAAQAYQEARVQQILKENPEMVRNPALVAEAEKEAFEAGHLAYSDVFHEDVRSRFQTKLAAKTSPPPEPSAVEEALEGARHPAARMDLPEPRHSNSFVVSAPVSRETGATGYSDRAQGRVRLTAAMKEAARIAGISEAEYAAQVLRLREEKEAGNYGGSP